MQINFKKKNNPKAISKQATYIELFIIRLIFSYKYPVNFNAVFNAVNYWKAPIHKSQEGILLTQSITILIICLLKCLEDK